ncbi:MAG: cell division protein FtsQ/DivIB [Candidatus Onthomonas sp.]
MATQRKHKRRERRQNGRLFRLYIILSALLILGAVVAGSVVFFKAHTFEVEGNQRYSREELLEASGIRDGENLLSIPRREIEKRMEAELPYLKQVSIHLWPPERVIITVEETEPAAALESEGTLWYIDSSGKLLERVERNEGYPAVNGLTLLAPSEGTQLAVSEEEELKAKGLRGLLAALEERDLLDRVQSIDLTSGSSVSMGYDNRLTVKMGLNDDFGYDLKMLQAAEEQYIQDNWSDADTGTLDMTKRDGEAVLSKN